MGSQHLNSGAGALAIQLGTDCSCHTAPRSGATGLSSGPGMRQLFGSSAVYPSVMASHPLYVQPSYRRGENEGCFLARARTAQRIFLLVREYEAESWTNEEPHTSLRGRPAGRPGREYEPAAQAVAAAIFAPG